jgi:Asp-tRNA(Asn)/Glu-tRNA(Gln) amidotransferase A subunit family amidase
MDIQTLKSLYAKGVITPEDLVNEVYERLKLPSADPAVWLRVFPKADTINRARDLLKKYPDPTTRHPLFGIPFSIKDSIDIKGAFTTAACPEYAYVAENDAPSYATLIEAGCIPIGKVNLVRLISSHSPLSYLLGQRINWRQVLSVCDHHMANQLLYSPQITFLVVLRRAHVSQLLPIKSRSP